MKKILVYIWSTTVSISNLEYFFYRFWSGDATFQVTYIIKKMPSIYSKKNQDQVPTIVMKS